MFSFLFMSESLKDGSQLSEILKGFSGGKGLPQAKDDSRTLPGTHAYYLALS